MHLGKDFLERTITRQNKITIFMKRKHLLFDVFLMSIMTFCLGSCIITYETFTMDVLTVVFIMGVFLVTLFVVHRYRFLDDTDGDMVWQQ